MNVNKGDMVYAINQLDREIYTYRKEKFIRWYNKMPICTYEETEVEMGYDEICFTEKEAKSRCNRLSWIDKQERIKRQHNKAIKILADQYKITEADIISMLSQLKNK